MDAATKVMEAVFKALGGVGISGVGAVALGVILYVFRDIIAKRQLLANLTKKQSAIVIYSVIGSLTLLGLVAIAATLTAHLGPALIAAGASVKPPKTVTVILMNGKKQIKEPFTVTYTIGQGIKTDKAYDWQVAVQGVSANATTLNVTDVICDGYEIDEKQEGPYPIDKENIVRIPMVKIDKMAPPDDLPDVAKVAAPLVPPKDEIMQRKAHYKTDFLLTVKNLTGEQLTLALYNGYAHYHQDGPQPPQMVFANEVDAGKQTQRFPRLVKVSTGICVPCIIAPDRQVYPFHAQDFYATPAPLLTITKTDDPDRPYTVEFGEAPDN